MRTIKKYNCIVKKISRNPVGREIFYDVQRLDESANKLPNLFEGVATNKAYVKGDLASITLDPEGVWNLGPAEAIDVSVSLDFCDASTGQMLIATRAEIKRLLEILGLPHNNLYRLVKEYTVVEGGFTTLIQATLEQKPNAFAPTVATTSSGHGFILSPANAQIICMYAPDGYVHRGDIIQGNTPGVTEWHTDGTDVTLEYKYYPPATPIRYTTLKPMYVSNGTLGFWNVTDKMQACAVRILEPVLFSFAGLDYDNMGKYPAPADCQYSSYRLTFDLNTNTLIFGEQLASGEFVGLLVANAGAATDDFVIANAAIDMGILTILTGLYHSEAENVGPIANATSHMSTTTMGVGSTASFNFGQTTVTSPPQSEINSALVVLAPEYIKSTGYSLTCGSNPDYSHCGIDDYYPGTAVIGVTLILLWPSDSLFKASGVFSVPTQSAALLTVARTSGQIYAGVVIGDLTGYESLIAPAGLGPIPDAGNIPSGHYIDPNWVPSVPPSGGTYTAPCSEDPNFPPLVVEIDSEGNFGPSPPANATYIYIYRSTDIIYFDTHVSIGSQRIAAVLPILKQSSNTAGWSGLAEGRAPWYKIRDHKYSALLSTTTTDVNLARLMSGELVVDSAKYAAAGQQYSGTGPGLDDYPF